MIKIPANMLDKLVEVNFSDATFIQTLQECMNSAVFRVAVRGESCVMKMYHDGGPFEWDPPNHEVSLLVCESTAYQRMKAKGLCSRGVVPGFYGTITKIQPALWPRLHMFLEDYLPQNAILIEYTPDKLVQFLKTPSGETSSYPG